MLYMLRHLNIISAGHFSRCFLGLKGVRYEVSELGKRCIYTVEKRDDELFDTLHKLSYYCWILFNTQQTGKNVTNL